MTLNNANSSNNSAKKSINPLYFIFEAFANFWRNRVMSIAAVLVLTSCLILLGAFALLVTNLNKNIERLGELNEIVVFVDSALNKEQVYDIMDDINELDNVSFVEYKSKEDGLAEMREVYADYSELFDEMDKNGDNPLSDSFIITYKDNDKVYQLESDLHAIPGVSKVNNRIEYAVKVENFRKGISFVFVWFLVLLFAVSIFVIFNTIRIAVHGRKTEIDIMRYIGASKSFIVTPFVIEGSIIGCVSGIVAYITVTGLYRWILKATAGELQMIEFLPISDFTAVLLLSFLGIGVLSGVLTSIVSLRKNLNN